MLKVHALSGQNSAFCLQQTNPNYRLQNNGTKTQNLRENTKDTFLKKENISFERSLDIRFLEPEFEPENRAIREIKDIILKRIFKKAQKNLREMAANEGSWINLPSRMLKNNTVDSVYKTVEEFKAPFGEDSKVIFVSLGNPGSAHETATALGYGENIIYCCANAKHEVRKAIKQAGGDIEKIQVIVASKSGTTFESNNTYSWLKETFADYYKEKGMTDEEVKQNVAKHFLCLTDKNPSATLKADADANGFKTIPCVDGVASGFADLAYDMPLLAWAGVPKETTTKMLEAAEKLTKEILETPFNENVAAKSAAYDKEAIRHGASQEQFIFHDAFLNMRKKITQLWGESLRKVGLQTHLYPEDAHINLEASISTKLPKQPRQIITNLITTGGDKTPGAVANEEAHFQDAKNQGHWQKILEFPLTQKSKGVEPEAIAEFLTLKSFVAYFKNVFESTNYSLEKISFVEGYKNIRQRLLGKTQ